MAAETKKLWDKLPGESTRWYSRFIKFRDMGVERSVFKSFCLTSKGKSTKKPNNGAPGAWKEACEKFNWHERAQAWDLDQIQKAEDELRERQRREQEEEMEDARRIREKGREILEKLPVLLKKESETRNIYFPASATEYNSARALLAEAAKLYRLSLGMPLDSIRVDNLNIDLSNLSDSQLERISKGENVLNVLASTRTSRAGTEKTE
jgi:hypothetical protein